ncbi:alpha/beta hydrolase [Nocardioides humilatus]|uniref:Alpha/beta hydrolase n=1 Tax=Nocardioides humilatus TaxID=2607660 RepID=A0A5B1L694_9ACTN|nr:alpha/beta hydrolase [Nocardioides humilatus]KAA1415956.1 alpha/beta hydrolase [Nocardioides humilatus]
MTVRKSLRLLLRLASWVESSDSARPVEQRRASAAASPLQMRTVMRRARGPLSITDHQVELGDRTITVRVYRSPGPQQRPAHVFLHGGAFWLGSVAEYGPLCRWYALKAGCVVVSVDYRLAPESPYPAAVEDAYAALRWVFDQAEMLGVDARAISIGGVSAGGGIAAATAIVARDRGGPALRFQLLEIPVTDLTLSQPSTQEFAEGFLLTRAELCEGYGFYVPDPGRRTDPYASPLLAADLKGLPPAFILTAECDPLRDEGEAYGRRLEGAGVPVRVHRASGHVHGSTYLTRFMPSARAALAATTAALAEGLATKELR